MSSPNRSTSNIEDAFSSMNILNYTSVSSDYFPASSGSISFNSSEDSNIIPSVNSPFYNNPYLKDMPPMEVKLPETPTITLAAIQQLINDGITAALEAQAATMANADNPNRNTSPQRLPV
ncbi:hypothetical protein Tco_0421563 [Tanacetum coccineum]